MIIKSSVYNIGCQPSPSLSAETLIQDSHKTYLLFFAVSNSVDEKGCLKNLGVAILSIEGCIISKFGYPNNEGLPEHPFFEYGLAKYPVLEITNSSWVEEILEQIDTSSRRIRSNGFNCQSSEKKSIKRHFIITLSETTFECIASSLIVERYCETFDEAFSYVVSKLSEN
jgi:hypothetical protein